MDFIMDYGKEESSSVEYQEAMLLLYYILFFAITSGLIILKSCVCLKFFNSFSVEIILLF